MIDFNHIYDVLVLGGGNAGVCAAITAREAGASVLLLEHAPRTMRGGNSRHTRNLRIMHEAPTATLTESYREPEYWKDLVGVTKGKTDDRLALMTIRATAELLPWMEQHGVRFQPSLSGTLHLSRTNAFFLGGGKALINAYYASAERCGVGVLYDAEARSIQLANGRVESVCIAHAGSSATVRAKTVVVSSGGFQANIDWLREYWGDAADHFVIRGTPYAKGLLLKNLLDQGVQAVGDPTQCHAIAVDARAPRFDGGIVTRLDCIPFSIVVNRMGKRFYDEGEDFWPKRYAIWGRQIAQQPDQIAFSITDAKCENLFMPSVFPAIRENSIAGLADAFGTESVVLEATVREYNNSVRGGTFNDAALDDCYTEGILPPKTHWAQRIDQPPFIGYPLRPGITFTYLGVKVSENAQVLMRDAKPCENLFAAGEIMAGNILGEGYLAGLGMSIGSVFGRIAGREAARIARA